MSSNINYTNVETVTLYVDTVDIMLMTIITREILVSVFKWKA